MSPETPLDLPQTAHDFEELALMPMEGSSCPFLGLDADGTIMLSVASSSHRCFAAENVRTPRIEFQQQFCLRSDHVRCATYQAAAQQPPAHLVRPAWRPAQKRSAAQWFLLSAAVLALLLLVGAYFFLRQGGGSLTFAPATQVASASAAAGASTALAAAVSSSTPTAPPAADSAAAAGAAAAGAAAESAAASGAANRPGASQAAAADATLEPTGAVSLLMPTPTPPKPALVADRVESPAVQAGTATGGATLTIYPIPDEVGWWRGGAQGEYALADSFLNAGQVGGDAFISAVRFSLRDIPRGAPILSATLALSGLKGDRLNTAQPASWLVELIGERELGSLSGADFMMIFSAPNSVTLPVLRPADLSADGINRLELDANALGWLEQQRLAGAESLTMRIVAQVDGTADTLFAWDSGHGPKSQGRAPALLVQTGDAPPTPPPVPTEDLLVATFTPAPQNVVTLVAQQATATFVAQTTGTYTPAPRFATPTPFARSLATVQAIARNLGQPGVVLETPVPANSATETAIAEYATAVALTTGTFTPVPEAYVTPVLIVPPLPGANPTEDERQLVKFLEGTALPYNAVIGAWVLATPTPQNVATAAAMSVRATADAEQAGPATATPWGQMAFTPVPPPLPTATPTTPLVQSVTSFTPTPELIPTATPPSVLPAEMLNKVMFRSDRFDAGYQAITMAYDPATNTEARINASWAMTLATQLLPLSPDGQAIAIVHNDDRGLIQIFIKSLVYGSEKQLTNFAGKGDETRSYDPAWSPKGDWIAFVSNNSGNDEVYRITTDGSLVEQLTHNSWEWDKHPTWSPDGSQIVFFSNRDTKRKQLFVMNADGSNQRQLISNDGNDWDPVWTR